MQQNTHTFGRNLLRYAAIAVALASPALMAQSEDRIGISGSFTMPMGSLKDVAGPGFSLGASYEMPLFEGFVQRGALEFTVFGTKSEDLYYFGSVDYSVKAFSCHYDLNYYLGSSLYALGGLSYHSYTVTVKAGGHSASTDPEDIDTKVGLNIGAGYNVTNNIGLEFKYIIAADPWVQLSARWRF
ncbi:MAG: porin family protein [Holophagales bacterium]|jgi:opacity protein-like surface antigen|nr:porin family protein [Holophagales bacterium]